MECTKCSFNNPEQASFCGGCGSSITKLKCGQCKAENTAGSRSCNTCGQPLSATSELLSAHTQRRILSVLFCDLVDLTSLVVSLGPEVSRSVIRDFKVISKEAVEKLGGRVTTYLGDGIVALFSQHETNAERAINTALQINCDIEHIGKHFNLAPSEIKVCCGIATGLAIVGDDMLGHSQVRLETAVGLPMNLAARIQDFAEPGGVAIDQESYAATRGLFRFEDSGHHHLKGIREPQQIWKVLAEKSISSRFVAQAAEVSAMVDRVEILQELIGYWERSVDSDAQLVLFYGEAGVGKSRIAQEMVEIISMKTDYHHLEYQCSSYHRHTAFYPVINRMKAVAGIEPADTVGSQLAKLELLVKGSSTDMSRDMPAFADMLALPVDDTWPMSKIDPGAKKEWVFDTLVRNMLALADTAPLLISIEDVHWIDPTTLELINRVAREISGHEIMLLLTSRQGFADEFRELPGITILEVDRLPEKFAQQLFEQIKGEVNMSANLQAEILRRTEGIPLYIEELSKSLIEGMLADRSVFSEITPDKIVLPGTLQESLQSRLDRLPDTSKSIAQIAAVIGREFSFDLLEEVAGYRDKNLYQVLTPLLQAQMVIQRKEPPNAEFSYKHALIRDAVYEAILKTDLVKIHKRIAYVIEGMYPEIARSNPGLLARHFTEGRVCTKAVKYWLMAGKNSAQQFALIEARSYLTKGLGCLDQLTDQGQIQPQSIRLEFLAALGPILMALEGSGSEVTKKHYANAVVLCAEMPESSMKFAALWGQWLVAKDSEDDHGLVWAEQLQELSRKLGNTELNLQAHHCHWVTHFHLGNFNSADDHIKEGLGLYDYACHGENASNYGGHDAKVCGDGFLAQILWFQGDEMAAQEKAEECYKWAAEIKHQASLLHALELNILLHLFRKDESQIRRFYRKLKNICDELDLPEYEAKLKICCGMVKTYDGEAEQGIELMNNGLEQTLKVGTHEDIYLYGELIGEACLRQHHYEEGLECINRVIDIPESPDKQYWGAEIYRRKGELQQQLGDYVGALKSYEMAMDTAKVQHTRILGLRAAISLFRFNHLTGLCPRAVARLKVAHGDFLNGGSSPEQETARYLLSQIN